MKITGVRSVQPIADNSPNDWRTSMGQILVAIDTDSGLTGYGVGGGGAAGMHVIHSVLRDVLIGRDPAPVEQVWSEMYRATLPFGRRGLAIMALSGVDLALWDLRGKVAGVPIAALLSQSDNAIDRPVPMYCTVWNDAVAGQCDEFSAFKLHVGHDTGKPDIDAIVHAVQRMRDAIGTDKGLMIDAWMKWDPVTTLAVADRIANLRVDWIEEPLPVDDLEDYATLCRCSPIPIAGGEHEFTMAGFRPLIDRRLHHVLQPDVCWCGGMTQLVEIYRHAGAAGLRVCPHRGAEVWALHAIAALDPEPLAESGRPWMTWVGGQPQCKTGHIRISDAPGFGVFFDEQHLP